MNGKQLKNSILQWAIQGKLVPQDPNDEPASVLLERIRAEKAKLVKEKKIKKDKNESIIYRGDDNSYYEKFLATGEVKCIDDEIPFEIPQGWEWCRLCHVTEVARGGSPRPIKDYITESPSGINWIKIGDTEKGGKFIFSTKERIKPEGMSKSRFVHKGDFLLTNSMSFGRPYITQVEGCIHDGWLVISLIGGAYCQDFLYYLLSSNFAYAQFSSKVAGAVVQNLNSDKVANSLFPIPPKTEQKRIVQKIESILPKVHQYEELSNELASINIAIHSKLKKSILQEAIQGKLVPQIKEEGTAEELLVDIRTEKGRLVKEGKLKKSALNDSTIFKGDDNKYFEKIGNTEMDITDEIPFEIPDSWSWVRLNDICSYIQRGKSPKYSLIKKYPVVAQKCNQWSGFSIDKAQFIDPDTLSSYGEERILQDGDLMWNSTGLGTLGRMAIYWSSLNPYELAVADSHVTVIRAMKKFVMPQYLYYYFTSNTVQSVIEDKSDGSTKQKELATATVKTYLVPIPPLMEQDRIISKIKQLASIMRG